jgi:hypothetical protein
MVVRSETPIVVVQTFILLGKASAIETMTVGASAIGPQAFIQQFKAIGALLRSIGQAFLGPTGVRGIIRALFLQAASRGFLAWRFLACFSSAVIVR